MLLRYHMLCCLMPLFRHDYCCLPLPMIFAAFSLTLLPGCRRQRCCRCHAAAVLIIIFATLLLTLLLCHIDAAALMPLTPPFFAS